MPSSDKSVGSIAGQSDEARLRDGLALLVGWKASRWVQFWDCIGGDPEQWWSRSEPDWDSERYAFLTKNQRTQLQEYYEQGPDSLLRQVEDWPGQVIVYGQEDYPNTLLDLDKPPAALHAVGELGLLGAAGLAVVGSRKIGVSAASAARRVLEPPVRQGLIIISGGALGSDALAHRCAVDSGGQTIAVLPSGLRSLSPKSNRRLFGEIVDGGGVLVSEYPPYQGVRRYHFKRRNGLIAALSRGVLVLRAAKKSGTKLTIDAARNLERPLGAMPGRPEDPLCRGCHDILRSGGQLIARAQDLTQWWKSLVPDAFDTVSNEELRGDDDSGGPIRPDCQVLDQAVELLDAEGSFSMEALERATNMTVADLQTVLLGHELSGIIERIAGGDRFRFR